MNILPQNIQFVLKNKIKNAISCLTDNLVDSLMKNMLNTNEKNSYIDFMSTIEENQRNMITKIVEETLQEYDQNYKNSDLRKKSFTINKSNVPRTITTIFGEITFTRTYYKSLLDGSLHFLLDEELNLPKYHKYDPIVKGIAINNAFDTNQKKSGEITGERISSLKQSLITTTTRIIPRQSIHNWINDWIIPKFNYPERQTPKTLFVMVDEKFLGCQDLKNDIMAKVFVAFEGVKTIGKNRRSLINKFVFPTSGKNAWEEFVNQLYKIYDSEKIKHIYVMSDGGKWIKAGISELKTNPNQVLTRLLCEFHLSQSINRMTSDKDARAIIKESFKNDDKKMFFEYVDELFNYFPERKDIIEKNKNYILNNYKAMKDMQNFEIGSSMESHISHCIASYFSSRPKGYSSNYIAKYLKINDYKNNGLKIQNLYFKTYSNKKEEEINSQNLNWNIFENYSLSIPSLNSPFLHDKIKFEINQKITANAIL